MKKIADIQVLHLGVQSLNDYLENQPIQFDVEQNQLQWVENGKVVYTDADVLDAYIKNFDGFWEHFDATDIQNMNELSFIFARNDEEQSFGLFFNMFPQV